MKCSQTSATPSMPTYLARTRAWSRARGRAEVRPGLELGAGLEPGI